LEIVELEESLLTFVDNTLWNRLIGVTGLRNGVFNETTALDSACAAVRIEGILTVAIGKVFIRSSVAVII
jgi:hypothetical protein